MLAITLLYTLMGLCTSALFWDTYRNKEGSIMYGKLFWLSIAVVAILWPMFVLIVLGAAMVYFVEGED